MWVCTCGLAVPYITNYSTHKDAALGHEGTRWKLGPEKTLKQHTALDVGHIFLICKMQFYLNSVLGLFYAEFVMVPTYVFIPTLRICY